jgi:Ca2+-binding EF-hand superfamily protein
MRKINLIAPLLLLLVSCKTTSQSSQNSKEQGTRNVDEILTKMDVNNDGKLSYDEAKEPLKENFVQLDTNKDLFLSKAEVENAPKPDRQRPSDGEGGQQQGQGRQGRR